MKLGDLVKKKLSVFILFSLFILFHNFVFSMFTIGRESERRKGKAKRKLRELVHNNQRNIPLFSGSTIGNQGGSFFVNSASGTPAQNQNRNTTFSNRSERESTFNLGSGPFENVNSNFNFGINRMHDEGDENTFTFRQDRDGSDFLGNLEGYTRRNGDETINLNFGDIGSDIAFGNTNKKGISEENNINMREERYINSQDFGPGNNGQNNWSNSCQNNWPDNNSFSQHNRRFYNGNYRSQQNQNQWRQGSNNGNYGPRGPNQNQWRQRPNMGWQQRQQRQQQNAQRNMRLLQREMQAKKWLFLFLKFTLGDTTIKHYYIAKSFLLGLQIMGADYLIKSQLFHSMLPELIKKSFAETENISLPGPPMTATVNAMASRMKRYLNQILLLIKGGLNPDVLGMLAISGLYWFDIIDLACVGLTPNYFKCLTTDTKTIKAIVKNKKYMPAFFREGFTCQQLMFVITELDTYYQDLKKLNKDRSEDGQLKRECFFNDLRIKTRSYGAECADLDDDLSPGLGHRGFFNQSPQRRRMVDDFPRRNIHFDLSDDLDSDTDPYTSDDQGDLGFEEEDDLLYSNKKKDIFNDSYINSGNQGKFEEMKIATPPVEDGFRQRDKEEIDIPTFMFSFNKYREVKKDEFKKALFRKKKKKKSFLTLGIKPFKYKCPRIII